MPELKQAEGAAAYAPDQAADELARPIQLAPQEPQKSVVEITAEIAAPEPPATPVVRYRVGRDSRIIHRGNVTIVKAGKVVDETNYDIRRLVEQGVALERIDD
jgi:hypothetical protein